jgi:dienelactone hydrolase
MRAPVALRRASLALLIGVITGLLRVHPGAAADWREVNIPFPSAAETTLRLDALEAVPAATGRYPLVVISHGAPRKPSDRPGMYPAQYRAVGQWFANNGFAVVIPMRRGYGHSGGTWVEGPGNCRNPNYVRAGKAGAQDIEAVLSFMRAQPFVDPNRIVLVGHSAGGWASIATASEDPPGVAAAILFAPGRGSFAPDQVCRPDSLAVAARGFGVTTHIPTLWIYADNDHFFAPTLARAIFDAFHGATPARATFIDAPACWRDGHVLIYRCPEDWHAAVETFLRGTAKIM